MQATYESHQFYSPVTNWKSKNKNRRRQQILALNPQNNKKVQKNEVESPKIHRTPRYSKSDNSLKSTIPLEIPKSKSTCDDLAIPKRGQSLGNNMNNMFPKASLSKNLNSNSNVDSNTNSNLNSKPIAIPSSNEKTPKMMASGQNTRAEMENKTNFNYGNHSLMMDSPPSSPPPKTHSFRKNRSMGSIPKVNLPSDMSFPDHHLLRKQPSMGSIPKRTSPPIRGPSMDHHLLKKDSSMSSLPKSASPPIRSPPMDHHPLFRKSSPRMPTPPRSPPGDYHLLRKNPMGPIPSTADTSFVNGFKSNKNNIREIGYNSNPNSNFNPNPHPYPQPHPQPNQPPRINTTNLSNVSNSLDSGTLVDSAHSESSSYFTFRRNLRSPKMVFNPTPEPSCNSSVVTNIFSPSLSSVNISHDMIDHESSVATLVQSPPAGESSLLSMNNDQLFKLLPRKIVKALDSYTAQNRSTEISYSKGDFFFVISENDTYYFVTNPSTKQSGYVSKFSFEQVDHFSKQPPSFGKAKASGKLSPIVEDDDFKFVKERTGINDRIMTACVNDDILIRNTQYKFQIEITKIDGTVAVLNRSYNDICELHRSLLEYFPEDAGTNRQERILPFLPSFDTIFNHPSRSPRQIISYYLQQLTKLPNYIQFSYPFDEFFRRRKEDILSSMAVVSHLSFFEDSEDLLSDLHSTLKVKFIIEDMKTGGQEVNSLRVDPDIDYFDLFDMLEERFDRTFSNIFYKNEMGEKVKVFGDGDLKLFFNSNNLSFVLWAK